MVQNPIPPRTIVLQPATKVTPGDHLASNQSGTIAVTSLPSNHQPGNVEAQIIIPSSDDHQSAAENVAQTITVTGNSDAEKDRIRLFGVCGSLIRIYAQT